MKKTYYDVYGERNEGEIIHIDRVYAEKEARSIVITEENENPDGDFWWEVVYADEQ